MTEVALIDPAEPAWVLWVEIRAVGGTPDLEEVLRGLDVRP